MALGGVAIAVVSSAVPARADVFQTFDVTGTVTLSGPDLGFQYAASGSLDFDVTLGIILSASVSDPYDGHLSGAFGGPSEINMHLNGSNGFITFQALFSDPVDGLYTDGSFSGSGPYAALLDTQCASSTRPATCNPSDNYSFTGTLTADPTPLPAALPLFVTGIGGLGLLGWRRKREGVVLGPHRGTCRSA
jgi:hypothetical protein